MKGTKKNAMEIDELPKVHLPGDEKFQSYKTSLQNYCRHKKIPVPQYAAEKLTDGVVGTVSFSGGYIKCKETSGNIKEADSRAAFQALKQLGYLRGQTFEVQQNQLKRKVDNPQTDAKQVKPGTKAPLTLKAQLNEIAQKSNWEYPTYNTVSVPGGFFFTTVTINNAPFKSMSVHKAKKESEEDAAEVALNALRSPLPTAPPSTKASPALPAKTRLQQYCQKSSKQLPQYETRKNEDDGTFQSIVTVDGVDYCGLPQAWKKMAEFAAAEEALMGIIRKGFIV